MWDRQQDPPATMAGRLEEVGRISQLIIQGAQEWHGVQAEQTTVGSGPGLHRTAVWISGRRCPTQRGVAGAGRGYLCVEG